MYEAALLDQSRAAELVEHAAECPACGALLADMHTGSQIESDIGPLLKSGTESWKQDMLRRIAGTAAATKPIEIRARSFPVNRSWLAVAATMVLLVSGGAWWFYRTQSPEEAQRLLARAYSKERPFDLRIPGTSPGPVRAQRGAALTEPAELAEARSLIASHLRRDADSPEWRQAFALAELLERRYDSAITLLEGQPESQTGKPEVLGLLGIAYLERATP